MKKFEVGDWLLTEENDYWYIQPLSGSWEMELGEAMDKLEKYMLDDAERKVKKKTAGE